MDNNLNNNMETATTADALASNIRTIKIILALKTIVVALVGSLIVRQALGYETHLFGGFSSALIACLIVSAILTCLLVATFEHTKELNNQLESSKG